MNEISVDETPQGKTARLISWESRIISCVTGLDLSLMAVAVLAEGAGYSRVTGFILVGFGSALSLAGIALFIAFAIDGLIKRSFFMVLGGVFMVCLIVEMSFAIKAVLFASLFAN